MFRRALSGISTLQSVAAQIRPVGRTGLGFRGAGGRTGNRQVREQYNVVFVRATNGVEQRAQLRSIPASMSPYSVLTDAASTAARATYAGRECGCLSSQWGQRACR